MTLGRTWLKYFYDMSHSFQQIVEGLLSEVMRQIELIMININQFLVLEAKANLKETWDDLFSLVDVQDRYRELTCDELKDPNHPVSFLLLYICQIQSFIIPEINRATKINDQTTVKTLGPFELALSITVGSAQSHRSDLEKYDCNKQQDLWRCGGMTAPEIQNLRNEVGKRYFYLPGYISCYLDKSRAMSFAWEDVTTGHQKVVVHIKWNFRGAVYFLDAGAYDHEQEVLLKNGIEFVVESVEDIKEDQ